MVKRTYSGRDRRRAAPAAAAGTHTDPLAHNAAIRKRRRLDSSDDESLDPGTIMPLRGGNARTSSLIKKMSRGFSGPVSIPDEEMDLVADAGPPARKQFDVFDRTLNGKLDVIKSRESLNEGRWDGAVEMYDGSRGSFDRVMKNRQQAQEADARTRKSHLPTPPSETQAEKTGAQSRPSSASGYAGMNGPVLLNGYASTKEVKLFEKPALKEKAKKLYIPKAYTAEETLAPRKDLLGLRLSKKSDQAKLWLTNQQKSSFLRLPSEIRNRIYEFAFGGNTIQICYETYRPTLQGKRVRSYTPIFKYTSKILLGTRHNPFKPIMPYINIAKSFTLLSGVCRQLYLETAGLPFKLNFLAFDCNLTLFNMLMCENRLSRVQREAISRFVVPCELPSPNLVAKLPNVERVFVHKESTWYKVVREEGRAPRFANAKLT